MPAYGTSRTTRAAVLPYDGVMRHPLTEGHTGLPEMDCPLITSEHSFRILRKEFHDFNRGRSQASDGEVNLGEMLATKTLTEMKIYIGVKENINFESIIDDYIKDQLAGILQ